ncbi:TetR/AcrR family transcriptional regulator [Lacticaseibacillus kribbianus]|uniref:TetR/AcrR family transcriptional regulator n=1 Tax=Lacticaseibacillus kribbianus TaxID=2926292 RepID=UPI001CD24FE3|nr:TetR/AcrR family transcriptional regulator [Lacticaseibacillus kribbianus]
MARKKTITRDQILTAAYELVVEEGFKKFTARNIARRMACSTQPIYLEFANMAELRQAVVDQIKQTLDTKMSRRYTTDPIVDLGLAYINFALDNQALYKAVFVEDHFGVAAMRGYALDHAVARLGDYPPAAGLSNAQRQNTVTGVWIVATGIANLVAAGFIDLSPEQMIAMLRAVTCDFITNDRFAEQAVNIDLDAGVANQAYV